MKVKIVVRASPYVALKRGSVGEVEEKKFQDTVYEIWKVRFPSGVVWSFHPDELEEVE